MGIRLVVDKGPLSGTVLILENGTSWSLGSDGKASDILLQDEKLAPAQVRVTLKDGEYYLENLDVSRPVLVNGVAITAPTLLKEGIPFVMGSCEWSFFKGEEVEGDIELSFQTEENGGEAEQQAQGSSQVESKTNTGPRGHSSGASSADGVSASAAEKEQKLAESFLASVEKGTGAVQEDSNREVSLQENQQAAPAKEKMNLELPSVNQEQPKQATPSGSGELTQSQNVSMEENRPSPDQNQQPQLSSDSEPVSKSAENQEQLAQSASASQEMPKQSEDSNSSEEKGAAAPEEKFPESEGDNPSSSEGEKTEEESNEEQTEEEEKKEDRGEVLAPFNVQDLFRFDQGIFPAEIEDIAQKQVAVDLTQPSRFLLKVLAGANIGAEFHLDSGRSYIVGSDPQVADIVLSDMSISRQHAKIIIGNDSSVLIEDLGSKNGVIVEGRKIEHQSTLSANQVVALGTTLFLLVDYAAPSDTVMATISSEDYGLFGRPQSPEEIAARKEEEEEEKRKRATLPTGAFILTLFVGGLALLFGIGTASLFHTKEIVAIDQVDLIRDIEHVIQQFPTVRYTFNKNNGQLFLIGHVKNSIDKSELLYKVDALPFVKSVDDNVIDDEAVWQEMNILLSKKPEFKGISMLSPEPGVFVISGYLKTEEQAVCLSDYLNLHFNYLSLLDNKIVIETQVIKALAGHLLQSGFANVQVAFTNGEAILTGYINNKDADKFRAVVQELQDIAGIRVVKNFVVLLPAEEGVIDLNIRYPGRYRVTGFSKCGDISINVVVNGRILTRGDVLDGMTITSIQPHSIFLEREGLKYKIEYNK
jgi:type III secretion apparatus protein, YscD/HrpQ family